MTTPKKTASKATTPAVTEGQPANGPESAPAPAPITDGVDATETTIREHRVYIDLLLQEALDLTYDYRPDAHSGIFTRKGEDISRHTQDCVHHLRYGKAWLGKVAEERGYAYPYPKAKEYQAVADIEPTADVAAAPDNIGLKKPSYVGQVTDLRNRIGHALQYLKKLEPNRPEGKNEARAWTHSYFHLSEAKMALGFEFQRLRNENV